MMVVIVFSYRPNVTVAFVAKQLAFPIEDKCVEWLTGIEGLTYVEASGSTAAAAASMAVPTKTASLDCKTSSAVVGTI